MKSDSLFYKYFQTLPEALLPEALLPEALLPEALLPEALLLLADEDIPSQTAAEYRFQSVEVKDL
jgi:hypothetical protein